MSLFLYLSVDAGTSRQTSKTAATMWYYCEIPEVAVVGIGKEGGGTIILCATCRGGVFGSQTPGWEGRLSPDVYIQSTIT